MPISYEDKYKRNLDEKRRVAERIWRQFISRDENPRVFIDAGTSSAELAVIIKARGGEGKARPVVMTHNWAAWDALRDQRDMDVYFLGGKSSPILNACIAPAIFQDQMKSLTPNIMIIAVSGIDSRGLYCSNHQDEAPIKAAIAKKPVEKRLIICDHTKIGDTDVRPFVSLEELETDCSEVYLITNYFDHTKLFPPYKGQRYRETLEKFNSIHGKTGKTEAVTESEYIILVPEKGDVYPEEQSEPPHALEPTSDRAGGSS